MFGPNVQRRARAAMERVLRPFAAAPISPNAVSVLGFVLSVTAATVIALGHLRWGGALVLIAGFFDMADGALARLRMRSSTFGAFLDSTLDRASEGVVLLVVVVYATSAEQGGTGAWVAGLAYAAAICSLLVSFARARAEGLGLECKVGMMERPERVALLGIGLLAGGEAWLPWVLSALVVATAVTVLQRVAHVRRIMSAHATGRVGE